MLSILLNTLTMGLCSHVAFIAKMSMSQGFFYQPSAVFKVHPQVLYEGPEMNTGLVQAIALKGSFKFTYDRIATRTQKPANFASIMIVIDAETTILNRLRLPANIAAPFLVFFNRIVLLDGQLIVVHQSTSAGFFFRRHKGRTRDVMATNVLTRFAPRWCLNKTVLHFVLGPRLRRS